MLTIVNHEIKCSGCGDTYFIEVTEEQLSRYQNKQGLIQDIFPELTPELRELFISKTCGTCWDEMFGVME